MKKLFALLLAVVMFNACKKENNTPTTPATDETPSGSVIASAKIVEGNKYILIWCKQFGVFWGGGQWM